MTIQDFVGMLSDMKNSTKVENPYRNEVLAHNLEIYLSRMRILEPTILLVGEAPGHKGCMRTGIPFTDEEHMMSSDGNILGKMWGYECLSKNPMYEKENSATVILDVLNQTEFAVDIPLMWNIFPFHPHAKNNKNTNCRPLSSEIKSSMGILEDLMELFPSINTIYAVGRVSENHLIRYGYIPEKDSFYVRHPSYGGKNECMSRLKEILARKQTCPL